MKIRPIPILSLIFVLVSSFTFVWGDNQIQTESLGERFGGLGSLAFYSGPTSPTPLLDLVQIKKPTLEPYYSFNFALNHPYWTDHSWIGLELETSISFYTASIPQPSFQIAHLFRWLETPWSKTFKNSMAFGVGLSYATSPPEIELITLPKTTNLLMHLIIEYAVDLGKASDWQAFFRIHHRSGAYGLFDGVVGGSDFLCLGVRKSIID